MYHVHDSYLLLFFLFRCRILREVCRTVGPVGLDLPRLEQIGDHARWQYGRDQEQWRHHQIQMMKMLFLQSWCMDVDRVGGPDIQQLQSTGKYTSLEARADQII